MIDSVCIKLFDHRHASRDEFAALNRFNNQARAEVFPDDTPVTLDEEIVVWRNRPPTWVTDIWAAWREGDIVGTGRAYFRRAEDNQHAAEFDVKVLPAYRGHGLARSLLQKVIELPQRENRSLLIGWTTDRVPAGDAFMERIGARHGMLERVSQLELTELNRDLMNEWLARAPERATGFALEFHEGTFPESDLQAIVDLLHVMNDAPREALELEDEQLTVEDVRGWQTWRAERGITTWTLFAREVATRKLAGFTETFWRPSNPELLQQGGTGVWPQYRNKGLGRWLKAAMIEQVLRECPQVKRIRTDNANSNAPMLKINYDLGFKHFLTNRAWQVEVQTVRAYLGNAT